MDIVKTKNIKFCAFLKIKGINPVEVNIISRGKAEYCFEIDPKEWEKWKVEFNKSDFLDYANNLESIKDLAY